MSDSESSTVYDSDSSYSSDQETLVDEELEEDLEYIDSAPDNGIPEELPEQAWIPDQIMLAERPQTPARVEDLFHPASHDDEDLPEGVNHEILFPKVLNLTHRKVLSIEYNITENPCKALKRWNLESERYEPINIQFEQHGVSSPLDSEIILKFRDPSSGFLPESLTREQSGGVRLTALDVLEIIYNYAQRSIRLSRGSLPTTLFFRRLVHIDGNEWEVELYDGSIRDGDELAIDDE